MKLGLLSAASLALSVMSVALPAAEPAVPVAYTRVYTADDGKTSFADEHIPMTIKDEAPPAAPLPVSASTPAAGIAFVTLLPNWDGRWHPAPRRQFLLVLQGGIAIETGKGERREFPTGSVVLVEDISGVGHRTTVMGTTAAVIAAVAVPK